MLANHLSQSCFFYSRHILSLKASTICPKHSTVNRKKCSIKKKSKDGTFSNIQVSFIIDKLTVHISLKSLLFCILELPRLFGVYLAPSMMFFLLFFRFIDFRHFLTAGVIYAEPILCCKNIQDVAKI